MATGTIILPIGAAVLPDGSSGNAAPGIIRVQGTETNPKKHFLGLAYAGATAAEYAYWTFRMPVDWASAFALKLQWQLNGTSNAVVWQARIAAVTPNDADTPQEHAQATAAATTTNVNTTEANRLTETSIDLSGVLDSLAAGDLVTLNIFRDFAHASDTSTVDAVLIAASIEYTTT